MDNNTKMTSPLPKERIFNSLISIGPYERFLKEIINLTESHPSSYVCFANVHMVIEAYKDPSFSQVVNEADIATPDGKPLAIFLRLFKRLKQDRVCGMDVLPDILRKAEAAGKSVYFYGTTDDVLLAMSEKAKGEFPLLKISGFYSPPFRVLSDLEKDEIVHMINASKADLVLVALGCPKQEKWMAEHSGKIHACMLGLGQAFHTYAGMAKRSPKWMQDMSLEWVYRLYLEPGRLWKRYLYTNSLFIFLSLKYFFKSVIGKSP